jgi:hypothetical protein
MLGMIWSVKLFATFCEQTEGFLQVKQMQGVLQGNARLFASQSNYDFDAV